MSAGKYDPLFQQITLAGYPVELRTDAPTGHIVLHPDQLERIEQSCMKDFVELGPVPLR